MDNEIGAERCALVLHTLVVRSTFSENSFHFTLEFIRLSFCSNGRVDLRVLVSLLYERASQPFRRFADGCISRRRLYVCAARDARAEGMDEASAWTNGDAVSRRNAASGAPDIV